MRQDGADLIDDLPPPFEQGLKDRGLLGNLRGHQASLHTSLRSLCPAGKLMRMRAAVIERYGEPPVLREVPEPKADRGGVVEVLAAPLNPVALAIAGGEVLP